MPDSPEWEAHQQALREYAEALKRWEQAEKLVIFHVHECLESIEESIIQSKLAVFYTKEVVETLKKRRGR